MLDMTELSTLKWLIFKWYYDFMVEAVILFAFSDPVYHPIPYPVETAVSSNLGHLLLEMEIKLHYFTCTMPTCLCHTRSVHYPGLVLPRTWCCPAFCCFPENCSSVLFLFRKWGHSCRMGHPNPTCSQPCLSPRWLNHCFTQGKKIFKEHIKSI